MGEMFEPGTRRHKIKELYDAGYTKTEAYAELEHLVTSQQPPFVFMQNRPGYRAPKEMAAQYTELRNEISRVYKLIERSRALGNALKATTAETPEKVKPVAKGKFAGPYAEKRYFIQEWKRLREWIADTSKTTGAVPIDSLDTMRPVQAANVLIDAGISSHTLLYAMCLHWPKAARDMAEVEEVDFSNESENLGDEYHFLAGYVKKLMECRQSVMLIGPAGTGKSHIARQVASLIRTESHPDGLPYGETPMTPGATRGDLLGRHTVGGFIPSKFVEIYSGGGVFNFEEIDASDPSMLIVVNNALSSSWLYNSVNGERYDRHPDFIAVSTANTFGLGADAKYTGREKLDLATIDRFRMGRVLVPLDESLAEHLMFG